MVLNPFSPSKHDSNTVGARFFEKKIGQIPTTFSRRGNSSASVDTSIHLHHQKPLEYKDQEKYTWYVNWLVTAFNL